MPLTLLVVCFLALILVIANRAQQEPSLQRGLFAFLGLINVGFVFLYGFVPALGLSNSVAVSRETGITALAVSIFFCGLSFGLMVQPLRYRIRGLFTRDFNPDSLPQMTALIFCVYLFGNTVLEFIIGGGLSGLARESQAITGDAAVAQAGIFVVIAMIGAGFATRRDLGMTLERLGLRLPTLEELSFGMIMSFLLLIGAFSIGAVWTLFTPPDVLEQQTQLSRAISLSVTTLGLAFVVSMSAAVGEEVAYRGALQPIFGLWPTAIFFALTHIQYTLTPATLVIIVVGLGLGWLRKRYNTTAAIVAHFLYNFALFFLSLFARIATDGLVQ
jgi:membrane protease YdiL (CAAX protease family)